MIFEPVLSCFIAFTKLQQVCGNVEGLPELSLSLSPQKVKRIEISDTTKFEAGLLIIALCVAH